MDSEPPTIGPWLLKQNKNGSTIRMLTSNININIILTGQGPVRSGTLRYVPSPPHMLTSIKPRSPHCSFGINSNTAALDLLCNQGRSKRVNR